MSVGPTYGTYGLSIPVPVRTRIFVSYHHAGDQAYYDAFSKAFHDRYEAVYDNSVERAVDSDNTDYVMRRIRENHITGTSVTIVLVGQETAVRKYVDWEIKATLDKEHALIGVRLPNAKPTADGKIVVPSRLHDNIESKYAPWITWASLVSSPEQLNAHISDAKGRSKALIQNARDMRMRNG